VVEDKLSQMQSSIGLQDDAYSILRGRRKGGGVGYMDRIIECHYDCCWFTLRPAAAADNFFRMMMIFTASWAFGAAIAN
jgi:hypothetical protein